jgi:hypothetical protein
MLGEIPVMESTIRKFYSNRPFELSILPNGSNMNIQESTGNARQ